MSETTWFSPLSADNSDLFNEGSHFRLYDKLGAKVVDAKGVQTPVSCYDYRMSVSRGGFGREDLNSAAVEHSGSGNPGGLETKPVAHHGRPCSLVLALSSMSVSFFINQL